jgi:hypothetical protein
VDVALAWRVGSLVEQHPTFGYRRLGVMPRCRDGLIINREALHRALRHLGGVHQRRVTPRPRVQGGAREAERALREARVSVRAIASWRASSRSGTSRLQPIGGHGLVAIGKNRPG